MVTKEDPVEFFLITKFSLYFLHGSTTHFSPPPWYSKFGGIIADFWRQWRIPLLERIDIDQEIPDFDATFLGAKISF